MHSLRQPAPVLTSLLLAAALCAAAPLAAQPAGCVPGQVLALLRPGAELAQIQRDLHQLTGSRLYPERAVSARMGLYLLGFSEAGDPERVLLELQRHKSVLLAQWNHYVAPRHTQYVPDDPQFAQQWPLLNTGQLGGLPGADIAATLAWDLSTGGLTLLGDTLVIAVIDEGFDLAHADLHFWKNQQEIPGNGLDDDQNGYADDYDGWNAYQATGAIPGALHGTHVAGIAGAIGGNALGVSGVCPEVQLLPVAGASGNEAIVMEAYTYVLEQRRRYDASSGQEGAFVVAANSSFGVDFGQPFNYPIWCALYDSLGAAGILSVVSTMNNASDVDAAGDIPSTCPSPFVLAVTNTTNTDQLNGGSAFGDTHIDLGAPGTQVYSTYPGSQYGYNTGTSMAAPHVSGAIALLFSAACPALMVQYRNDPPSVLLAMRAFLLRGVDTLAALQGLTASGGRLDAFKALLLQADSCTLLSSSCLPPFQLQVRNLLDTSAVIGWSTAGPAGQYRIRYRMQGSSAWTLAGVQGQDSVRISGLTPCAVYEYQVQTLCGGDSSGYFSIRTFRTEGCCAPPEGLQTASLSAGGALLQWQPVFGAGSYLVRYRESGSSAWQQLSSPQAGAILTGLLPCTGYEAQVQAICGSLNNGFSPLLLFRTLGCGTCIDSAYCPSNGQDNSFEWIAGVRIGPLDRVSGADGGYAAQTAPAAQLAIDSAYTFVLTPGFPGFAFKESWGVWLDADQDGQFADSTERLYQALNLRGEVTDTLRIPAGALPGLTRLRVVMRFPGFSGTEVPAACGTFAGGETEDYCVLLTASGQPLCAAPAGISVTPAGPDSAEVRWAPVPGASGYRVRIVRAGAVQTFTAQAPPFRFRPAPNCLAHTVQVQALCSETGSAFSAPLTYLGPGCGDCRDLSACAASGPAGSPLWIQSTSAGGQGFQTGPDGGYGDFTGLSIALRAGEAYTLRAQAQGPAGPRWWRAWADWNRDGAFSAAELVLSADSVLSDTVSGSLPVPAGQAPGAVRMRWTLRGEANPEACGTAQTGETEDYCLKISSLTANQPEASAALRCYPNPARSWLRLESEVPVTAAALLDLHGKVLHAWQPAPEPDVELPLPPVPAGLYLLAVERQGEPLRYLRVHIARP
ncbi:MAG: S8 family serine peptidase [Bacteroidia bacterium]|nr:S8 family serine peptidase [Bacteroidia bacterium]